jgi:hypothetical protein
MPVPQSKHTYEHPRPVTERDLKFYIHTMFVPHWKHKPSQCVTRTALNFFIVAHVHTLQETYVWASRALAGIDLSYLDFRVSRY